MRNSVINTAVFLAISVLVMGFVATAQAEVTCEGDLELDHGICVPKASATKQIDKTAGEIIANVLSWMLGIVGVLSLTMIVYSGIVFVTSAGDKERVESAKKTLTYAIVGLIVALISYAIVNTLDDTDLFGG